MTLRHILAFARLRWSIVRNGLTRRTRRDALEKLSGIASFLVPILLVLVVAPLALALLVGAFIGGSAIHGNADAQEGMLAIARILLFVLTGAVLVAPLVRSGMGHNINLGRILLLPIHRRVLHLSETLSALSDPWILVPLPALFSLTLGMLAAGRYASSLVMLAGGFLFALVLALLGATVSFGSALLFRRRRRGELISLILFSALSCMAFIPTLVSTYLDDVEEPEAGSAQALQREQAISRTMRTFPAWGQVLPSEQYSRTLYLSSEGEHLRSAVPLAALAGTAAVLYWLSMAAYRRLLEQPETGSRRRGGGDVTVRIVRFPGFTVSTSAVALLQMRAALRTIRLKSALFLTPVILLLLYLMFTRRFDMAIPAWIAGDVGPALAHLGILLGLLSLQPLWFNQFATDRDGLSLLLSSPVSDRQLIHGKALACGTFFAAFFVLCMAACIIVFPGGSPLLWLAAAANAVSAFLLMSPVAGLFSTLLPRTADLNRMGSKGNAHPLAGLIGTVASVAALAPGALLAAAGRILPGKDLSALVLCAGFALVAAAIAPWTHRPAAAALARRRENLAMVAQGR